MAIEIENIEVFRNTGKSSSQLLAAHSPCSLWPWPGRVIRGCDLHRPPRKKLAADLHCKVSYTYSLLISVMATAGTGCTLLVVIYAVRRHLFPLTFQPHVHSSTFDSFLITDRYSSPAMFHTMQRRDYSQVFYVVAVTYREWQDKAWFSLAVFAKALALALDDDPSGYYRA